MVAVKIAAVAFPGYRVLFAFDNAANHFTFVDDALVASRMNLNPGGDQPLMKYGHDFHIDRPQSMIYDDSECVVGKLRGKPKGIKVIPQKEDSSQTPGQTARKRRLFV